MKIPSFRYFGGKARIAKEVISYFPKRGNRYGEPFVGVGNIFWSVCCETCFHAYYLNDIRTEAFFRAIRELDEDEIPLVASKRLYEELKYQERYTNLAVYLEPFISPFGCGYESGGFTPDFSAKNSYKRERCIQMLQLARDFLGAKNPIITGQQWYSLNWWEEWDKNDFIYLDPPYYNTVSRTYPQINHVRLLDVLKETKASWIISGYENALYNNALGSPFIRINCNAEIAKVTGNSDQRIECLWRSQ